MNMRKKQYLKYDDLLTSVCWKITKDFATMCLASVTVTRERSLEEVTRRDSTARGDIILAYVNT